MPRGCAFLAPRAPHIHPSIDGLLAQWVADILRTMKASLGLVVLAGCAGGGGATAASDAGGVTAPGDAGDSTITAAEGGDAADAASEGPAQSSASDGSADVSTESGTSAEAGPSPDAGGCTSPATYDQTVLCDHPVAFWAMDQASANTATEPDLTGNGNTGRYVGAAVPLAMLPNGDQAADFDGSTCKSAAGGSRVMCTYLGIPSQASLSIPTTGELTWEGWIRPDVLQFLDDDVAASGGGGGSGYVDWMGKCNSYSPTCEWEARLYDTTTKETPNRPNRLSAYVFNPTAGLGSGADWQPAVGVIQAAQWYHVVGEYTTKDQPADCPSAPAYPGSISIWLNGVPGSQSSHNPTGCMSQYSVAPVANASALNIGTMAFDSWFQGAIGKVAIYGSLLSQAQISSHYSKMTGKNPTGTCANTCSL